jgi:hypothetical protein
VNYFKRSVSESRVAFASFFLIGLLTSGAAAQAANEQGWYLEQVSRLNGRHKLYISTNAVKSVNVSGGFSYLSHAPDWKVIIFNDRAQTYFDTTLDALQGESAVALYAPHRVDLEYGVWSKGADSTLQLGGKEVKTSHYEMTETKAVQPKQTSKFDVPYLRGVSRADYWELRDSVLPEHISALLRRIYVYPKRHGIPVQMYWLNLQRAPKYALETTKIVQQKLPADTFSAPKNYKRVANELLVYTTPSSNEAMEGFETWLGVPEKKKTTGK